MLFRLILVSEYSVSNISDYNIYALYIYNISSLEIKYYNEICNICIYRNTIMLLI